MHWCEIRPDFAPKSLLDIGAGPGTASWAAAETFSSLQDFTLLDANEACANSRSTLSARAFACANIPYERGEARNSLIRAEAADFVIASYMIGEIGEAEQNALAALMWEKTRERCWWSSRHAERLRADHRAARTVDRSRRPRAAPCPHDGKCPLVAPDWCHFTQRFRRSRAHKQVKGAELPFEDEKFAYVALTRTPLRAPVPGAGAA